MRTPRILTLIFGTVLAALTGGCATSSSGLKAKTVPTSAFLESAGRMRPHRARAPFNAVWESPKFEPTRGSFTAISVAPVTTAYLRPVNRPLVSALEGPKAKDRPVAQTAELLQRAFIDALRAPGGRHAVVNGRGHGVLVLELALVELNPTNVVGNAARYGAPGGSVLAPMTKGNIAIEGKLRDGATGELLYAFADNEQDRFSLVSLRDLSSFGHSRTEMKDWGRQFAELMRTPASHKVEDSASVGLNPF